MAQVLVVDDEESLREVLSTLLEREGHEVVAVESVETALDRCADQRFDLVFSDLKLGDGSGMQVLEYLRKNQPDAQVIMMTAFATAETAVQAMRIGAYDYQLKPFKMDEIRELTYKALEKVNLIRENQRLSDTLRGQYGLSPIVGRSVAIRKVLSVVDRVGPTKANTLIVGESGTGKELVARALHGASPRASGPFVPVNCGAIPANLIEAELFGHEAGAYTGATKSRGGLFEQANSGTILLDEVGELPAEVQVKLLRVLQERTVRRVGGDRERPIDARLVAATNRDLEAMVAEGQFREDLYYRLNVVRVRVPPLRDRPEDIPLLARTFLAKFCNEMGKDIEGFSREALSLLERFDYPGNVRQLENVVERAVALGAGPQIQADDLPEELLESAPTQTPEVAFVLEDGFDLNERLDTIERGYIDAALHASGGVKTRAAELLGLSFRSFRHRVKKLGLGQDGAADD